MKRHHPTPLDTRPFGPCSKLSSLLFIALTWTACGSSEPPGLELPERATASVTKDRPPPAMPSVAVEAIRVATRRLDEEVMLTGELRAAESVDLRAETAGRTIAVDFDEGQFVRAGHLMVKINDAELVAERKRTALRRDLAAQREQRLGKLVAEGTISQDLYDEAANQLAVFEAELELFAARIAETEVRAPFDGVVGLRAISVGSYLTPQTTITTIQALDPIKIDVTAAERYAGRIRRGDTLRFTVAGFDTTFEAQVYAVEPRIDSATRTIQVRARAANPGHRLLPGSFAKVRLTLGAQNEALMVPSIALVPGVAATTVFVVENGKAAERVVSTGTRTASDVEILTGLSAGDQVIVSGIQSVRAGTPVLVSTPTASPPKADTENATGDDATGATP
jgi:membrane fusion protein (multidrug efflux system)